MQLRSFLNKSAFYNWLLIPACVITWLININGKTPVVKSPVVTSYETFNTYRLNFQNTNMDAATGAASTFAYSYHIDLATVRRMISAGAYSVRVSNAVIEGTNAYILTPVNSSYQAIAGSRYMLTGSGLCPDFCDLALDKAAGEISSANAQNYISALSNLVSSKDTIMSFVLTKAALNAFIAKSTTANIRAYHLQNGNTRMIGLVATNSTGADITDLIYLQDASSLCPTFCD